MLRKQFDFIIGNPPWLSYRFISDPEYQEEVKYRAVTVYKIAPKSQRLITQMELGAVFLAHCMGTFANNEAKLGFVMPRGILSADQHRNLIERKYSGDAKLIQKRIGWHTLRHTFGTLLKANGEDVATVQSLMRHANVSVTMDRYVQAVTPAKRQAQRGLVGLLDPNGPTKESGRSASS